MIKKVFVLIIVLIFCPKFSFARDGERLIYNKEEVYAFADSVGMALPDSTDDSAICSFLCDKSDRYGIYITDENFYDLLVMFLQERNSKIIVNLCARKLAKKGNPKVIRKKARTIRNQISLEKIIPLACYLDLTDKEKEMVMEKSDMYGRAYLGDEDALKVIISNYKSTNDYSNKSELAKQLGKINTKLSISALIEDCGKEGVIKTYNGRFSYKYWFLYAMQYADYDYENRFFSRIIYDLHEGCLVQVADAFQLDNTKCIQKQKDYWGKLRKYALQKYGRELPEMKSDELLYYHEAFETGDADY
ncbi:MAG: hypothetical protein J5554_11810 [Paludibacteraceae bacterium]|nr:hypothetical protein [Paludibacteraceae bacterium]